MKIKKVLLLCDFFSSLGGTEYYNFILIKSLLKKHIQIRVYIGERPKYDYWTRELKKLNVEFFYPQEFVEDKNDILPIDNYTKSIKGQIRTWKPDIIHANPPGKMLVSFFENQVCDCPVVATEWTMPCENTSHWYPTKLKDHINDIDIVIATCNKLVKGIRNFHHYSGRIDVIPHLISPPNDVANHNTCSHDIYSVGCISRLSPEKGLDFLLGAWEHIIKDYSTATLHIYGHGSEFSHLKDLTKALGIEKNVFFEGVYDPVQGIENIVNKHQIFIQPSLFESIPTSIIELMGRGKIIIATDVGGVAELIDNEKRTGILIQRASTEDIYKAIKKVFTDTNLQKIIQRNSIEVFKEKYDLQKTIERILIAYESLNKRN